ncbi:MAG: hypothetical protein WBP11_11050 [Dokdonella sp.]
MKTRNVIVGLLVLVAIGAAFYIYWTGSKSSPDSAQTTPTTTSAAVTETQDVAMTEQMAASSQTVASTSARPTSPRERYVHSTNLLLLVEQLRADADAGDVGAIRAISDSYRECFPYAQNPELLDVDHTKSLFREPDLSIALALQRKQSQRCRDLIVSEPIETEMMVKAIESTVDLTDLTGQAEQLLDDQTQKAGDPSKGLSTDEIAAASTRVALSKDPEAIAMLALSQVGSGFPDNSSGRRRTNTYAWLLVACDFGRDCSADGLSVRRNCLLDRRCVDGDYRELLRRRILPPDEYELVLQAEREILQAINIGNVSHLFH